jgi:hypothetical protein
MPAIVTDPMARNRGRRASATYRQPAVGIVQDAHAATPGLAHEPLLVGRQGGKERCVRAGPGFGFITALTEHHVCYARRP